MLGVRVIKCCLGVLGLFLFMSGVVLAESQAVVKASIIEDDDSVYPNYLYVSGQLTGAGKVYVDSFVFGDYGYFFSNDKGHWLYITEKNRTEIQRLSKGDQLTDSFIILDTSGVELLVLITIKGINDKAIISGDSAGVVWEDEFGRLRDLRVLGRLEVSDVDAGESSFVESFLSGHYGQLRINGAGTWVYKGNNSLPMIQALAEGDFLTESFVVKSIDGTSHKLAVTIRGVNDLARVNGVDVGTVIEDDDSQYEGFLYTSAKLEVVDSDSGEAKFIDDFVVGNHGYFFIAETGEWGYLAINRKPDVQALSSSDVLEESFSVSTVDGTNHEVTVKIVGVDEAGVSGSIHLSWTIPFVRASGKTLPVWNIAGYRVYYGVNSGDYTLNKIVNDREINSLELKGLEPGTYYIAMTTYDREGRESRLSNEVVVTLK